MMIFLITLFFLLRTFLIIITSWWYLNNNFLFFVLFEFHVAWKCILMLMSLSNVSYNVLLSDYLFPQNCFFSDWLVFAFLWDKFSFLIQIEIKIKNIDLIFIGSNPNIDKLVCSLYNCFLPINLNILQKFINSLRTKIKIISLLLLRDNFIYFVFIALQACANNYAILFIYSINEAIKNF